LCTCHAACYTGKVPGTARKTHFSLITRVKEQEYVSVGPVKVYNLEAVYFHTETLRVNRFR